MLRLLLLAAVLPATAFAGPATDTAPSARVRTLGAELVVTRTVAAGAERVRSVAPASEPSEVVVVRGRETPSPVPAGAALPGWPEVLTDLCGPLPDAGAVVPARLDL